MMEELKLRQSIKVKNCNGVPIEGIIKGLFLDKDDKVNISVEHLIPVQNTFKEADIVNEQEAN